MYLAIKKPENRVNRIEINTIWALYGSTSIFSLPLVYLDQLICTLVWLLPKAATVSWVWVFWATDQIEQLKGGCEKSMW